MPDERDDSPDDRMMQEAEELMRQRRFRDAARRYQDLHRKQPTDLWTSLGFASALECAGEVETAEKVLEDAAMRHGLSASLHRFRHLFFVRREDLKRAKVSQQALRREALDAGESDQLADLYFNQGRYHEALAELERRLAEIEKDNPERAGLLARSGACLRQAGDGEMARDRLLMALALDPEAAWTLAELAEAERALGLADQARTHYQEALRLNPGDLWTRGHLAQLESEQGDRKAAIVLYEEILRSGPASSWAKVELAQVLADSDAERAGELCRSAIADDPEYPWAHAQLGQLARKAGHLDEALAAYQRAHKAAPESNWILHEATEVARQMNKDDIAERLLERARTSDPYDATTHGYLADLRRHQNRLRDAAAHLEQAVSLDPDYTWAWRELAEVRSLSGEYDAADEACKHARELAPDDAVSDGLVSFLHKHRGQRERGLPWLERAVERQPDYLWAWRELIELHLAAGRPAEAEQAVRAALVKLPGSPPILGLHAEALRRLGRLGEADEAVGKALATAGEVPQLWALRAEIALMREAPAEAVVAAGHATRLDRAPEYAILHAQTLLAAGDERLAASELARALAAQLVPAAAYELAAAVAERRGDRAGAIAQLDLALALGDDVRLRIRRVRIAVQGGDHAAAAALLPLVEQDAALPWAELALTLATAGLAAPARRAAMRHAALVPPAAAFQHLAEVEWHLGASTSAAAHVAAAVAAAPGDAAIRTLAAVIAEQAGDHVAAATHLEAALAVRPDEVGLLRQAALLRERTGDPAAAEAAWRRLAEGAQPGEGRHLELCAALWRLNRLDEARRLTEPHLAGPASTDLARVWRDRGVALARRDGPAAGLAALGARGELLGAHGRVLAIQLALAAGEVRSARAHLDALVAESEPERRARSVLAARTLLAEGKADEALVQARAAAAAAPGDEDPLIAAADALLALGRTAAALDQLDGPPAVWPAERAAVAACIALAVHGPAAAAARLTRCPRPGAHALGRLMAAALPDVAVEAAGSAGPGDVAALPPALVAPLATALGRAGRHDLAEIVRRVAGEAAARRGEVGEALAEQRAARRHLRARSGVLAALRDALAARDLAGLCRHLLP
jgi:tetratricopeptide (TPR) repeat protein